MEMRSSFSEEVKGSIRAEMQAVIKEEVSGRLERLETSLQQMEDFSQDVAAVKQSIKFTSQKLDDLHQSVLPAVASHIEQVATSLALQTLDLDMHRRKWSITIHGLKGKANLDLDDNLQSSEVEYKRRWDLTCCGGLVFSFPLRQPHLKWRKRGWCNHRGWQMVPVFHSIYGEEM